MLFRLLKHTYYKGLTLVHSKNRHGPGDHTHTDTHDIKDERVNKHVVNDFRGCVGPVISLHSVVNISTDVIQEVDKSIHDGASQGYTEKCKCRCCQNAALIMSSKYHKPSI